MPKFKVSLHGTGCWMTPGLRPGVIQQPRPMGFYTTRFVEAASPEEAASRAVEMVAAEVAPHGRPGRPCRVTAERVGEDEAGFDLHAPGAGFSWYPEHDED